MKGKPKKHEKYYPVYSRVPNSAYKGRKSAESYSNYSGDSWVSSCTADMGIRGTYRKFKEH